MKRVYVDMDGVLCNFAKSYMNKINKNPKNQYPHAECDFFRKLEPIQDAIESIKDMNLKYDVWILTRPSIKNPLCYTEKRLWVEDHLGFGWCKKLILCLDKSLMKGDYLIDDNPWPDFEGKVILFGSEKYPSWKEVLVELNVPRVGDINGNGR